MREEKPELVSFVLIGLVLASIFAGAVSGASAGGAEEGIDNITIKEAEEIINSRNVVVLDVRSQTEYESGHIAGAKLIPVSELEGGIDGLDKDKAIIVYCESGSRSEKAREILVQYGFENVYNMLGGITAWIDAGLPTTSRLNSQTPLPFSVAIADFSEPVAFDGIIHTDSLAYDLLIITPEEFQPALEPLAVHKSATGMPTTLKTLEHICGHFTGANDPEKIKRAIEHYHRFNGIKYVMLVGDVDKFPVRWVTYEQPNDPDTVNYYFPSDLYYADLYDADGDFNTWDYDGDGYFGEHLKSDRCGSDPYSVNADHADLHPDVSVGRVPASDIEEVESYVAKVIRYEYLTADADADWFHNVLLLAGRSRANDCDPGIHFNDTQTYLGDAFRYETYIHESYYNAALDDKRNCECAPPENPIACPCLEGYTDDQKAIFQGADGFSRPDASLVNIGFLAWHDHTSTVADYTSRVNNSNNFTVAFADGCSDGGFAGGPPGDMPRFAPTGAGGHDLPYREVGGCVIQVIFHDIYIDTDGDGNDEKFYNITNCTINGTWYPIVGDHCGGGFFPDMSFAEDFDDFGNLVDRNRPYILNPPLPDPLQPISCDREFNPETKLFAKNSTSSMETGWVGLVAATKGTNFPLNGELESLFFRGYSDPHSSVSDRSRLGDMWRSMLEYWLEEVFDDTGNFDFTEFFDKYDISSGEYNTFCWRGIESTMMNALFGDPSLRVGGVTGLEDNDPPVTFCPDGEWYGSGDVIGDEITILLTATDHGTPPSGVRETRYQVDNGTWETGNHVTIEAPSDHINDGIHRIDYYSIDFLGNNETEKTATIGIDTYIPPGATRVFLDGEEQPAMVICTCYCPDPDDCECECPERGCYVNSVTVSFNATDAPPSTLPSIPVSVIDYTEYDLYGWPYGRYTGPFPVRGGDILDWKKLGYWSWDNAGNKELHKSVSFCVSNWRAGQMRAEARLLAALEEIIAFRMRGDFVETLPLIKSVYFEAAGPYPTEQPEWTTIGTDYKGDDGWGVLWDTTTVSDGDYYIRMTVRGPVGMASAQLQQDKVIYQEQLNVTVCNIPNSSYEFNLIAPDEIDRGEAIEYTLEFVNKMDYRLTNLNMICDIDTGFFDKIKVLDDGYLSKEGRPTWFRKELKSGETWKAHFTGLTKPDIHPGTVITSQALITADTVPLLLSDDPTTPEEDDYTAVAIRLINGSITGKVEDKKYGTPIRASVAIDGPVTQKATTDVNGSYLFSDLLPGVYNVSVDAEDYDYHSPTGPVTVILDGTRASIQVDFFTALNDTIPPVSLILLSADEIVQESMTEIYGTAYDYAPGSGVRKVELSIERNNDRKYWDGDSWEGKETWLLASGTTKWAFKCGGIAWDSDFSYAIGSRATDNAGNVERPTVITTTSTLQAPALISPANSTSVDYIPTFEWSYVLDSCYYLQIDNDRGFRSPEIDASYLTDNTYTPGEIEEGTYYWRVKAIDMERGYPESKWSEVWAVTILPSQPPDLEIVKKWENWVDKEKGTYTVSYVVHNNGTTIAPAGHHTTLYIDEEAVEHKPVPVTLKPSDTYEDTFKTVVKCTPPGDKIMVCADNYDKVEELDEGNNCMTNVWQCPVPVRKPDLVIKGIKLSRKGDYCYVDYLISNIGTASASASTTYLSVDDKKIASDSTGALASGASRWDWFTAYRTTGAHTYKVCADGPNAISESSEANNCRTEKLTCPLSLDIYSADGGESPGLVYHYNTTTGIEETVYTRPSRNLLYVLCENFAPL